MKYEHRVVRLLERQEISDDSVQLVIFVKSVTRFSRD